MLFVHSGKLATGQGVDPHYRFVLRIANIEGVKQVLWKAEHHVQQIGTGQSDDGLAGGDDLMISHMDAGRCPAKGGDERHLA